MKNKVLSILICLFLLVVIVLFGYWAWLSECELFDHQVFDGYVATALGAVITLLLVYIAWWQLSAISGTSGGDFIHKLKSDFFTEETRVLMHLLVNRYIRYIDFQEEGGDQEPNDATHGEGNGMDDDDGSEPRRHGARHR